MSLTDTKIKNAKARDKVYRIADKKWLCVEVQPNGSKLWRYRYRLDGKASMFSLGAYPAVNLESAREARKAAADLVRAGVHPVQNKKAKAVVERVARGNTVKSVSAAWLQENKPHWSVYYYKQVERAFKQQLYVSLGELPIKQVSAPLFGYTELFTGPISVLPFIPVTDDKVLWSSIKVGIEVLAQKA